MTAVLPTDIIIQQCHDKKWQYPAPIENLDEWLASNTDAFDPRIAHRLYWPDRPYQSDMEILIIDGGTTQGPAIARTNPGARVVATVHTKESLDHAIYLKHKNHLGNLDFKLLPIDDIADLNQSFDLVIASGVLQQAGYTEAQLGMKALAQVLRPEGVAAILLYSRYVSSRPEAGYSPRDSDSFVHSSGVNFSVEDCLDLVEGAGLVFQDWLRKSPYFLPSLVNSENEFIGAISKLPDWQMWSVMEPLRNQTGCHLLTACRPDRPVKTYQIDFADPGSLEFIPEWRFRTGLDGRHAVRPGWSMPLDAIYRDLAEKIDGRRTIREIAGYHEMESAAVGLFRELWRMDFVAFNLGGSSI